MEYKIRHITTQHYLQDISDIILDFKPRLENYLSDNGDVFNNKPKYGFFQKNGLNPKAFEIVEFENNTEINCENFY